MIVNTQDPQSVAVAAYYEQARGIPAGHVFQLSFASGGDVLDADTFAQLLSTVSAAAGPEVQAYALTWTYPFIVADDGGCEMAITSGLHARL